MDSSPKLHVAMLPWLAYGHIMPYLHVSQFLAEKGHRVSFISTTKNIQNLPSSSHPLLSLVALPLPAVPGLPPSAESTADLPPLLVPLLKKAFDLLLPSLSRFLQASGVHWIVHDFNAYWLPNLAAQLRINSAYFSIVNASTHVFTGPPSEMIPASSSRRTAEDFTVVPHWVPYPSTVAFKPYEIAGLQASMDDEVSDFDRLGQVVQGSRLVAMRTCTEFEADELSLLRTLYQKPVVPVGFLLKPTDSVGSGSGWEVLREWLGGKKEKSVLYIAFGTETSLSEEWAQELARGIEESGVHFIWVRKETDPNKIPSGFEERVAGRGVVWKGFAPQVRVLGHEAVGGFMTHSGWSSVIEALGLGVPLVLFPGATSDLGLVARLLEDKGVGLEVERNRGDGSFKSEYVAQAIRRVMVDKEGQELRNKALAARGVFGNMDLQNEYLEEFAKFLENGMEEPQGK